MYNALFPAKRLGPWSGSRAGDVSAGDIPRSLAGLPGLVSDGGELSLHFPGCLPVAGPFVLFRLKREGFSSCRAEATVEGLFITARR